MKRTEFVKYLASQNCVLNREGKKHPIFINLTNGRKSTVPRHNELDDRLCGKICIQLDISRIKQQ